MNSVCDNRVLPSPWYRALHYVRWQVAGLRNPINSLHGVYGDFASAIRDIPDRRPVGYEEAAADGWYRDKHNQVALEDYPVAFWLRNALATCRSVFEVGGHVGVAYYGLASILEYPATLEWTICEVPSVARAGEALARERRRRNLRFVTHPSQSEGADILLAAGSLQYIESPSIAQTVACFRRRPAHVLINTVPAYSGPDFVTIQDIGSAHCPYRIFNESRLVGSLEELGYRLVASWKKDRRLRIPGHPERSFDQYSGYYLQLDASPA